MIKNKILIPIVIFMTLGFNLSLVQASHIVGGEMTYRCLDNGMFEISLTVYRDCYFGDPLADFDDPAWIAVFKDGGLAPGVNNDGIITVSPPAPFDTLRQIITSECFVEGDPVCVERATHITTVQLPYSESGYILSYQRCCRNETIRNIVDPDQTGANIWCYIPPEATQTEDRECNSNPVFNDYPPIYLCTDDEINFDHSATDQDGDQLVYSLCTPQSALSFDQSQVQSAEHFDRPNSSGTPFDPIVYQAPYDINNLLGGTGAALTIDPTTGLLTGVPTEVGQYLVGVCVAEYRDGELLSETRRDFQFNVRSCGNASRACIDVSEFNCESLEVNFTNCGVASYFEWTFGDLGTSDEVSPSFVFPEAGEYRVTLVAFTDDTCSDTAFVDIVVNDIVAQDILLDTYNTCNGDATITANTQSSTPVTVEWSLDPDFTNVVSGEEFTIPADIDNGQIVYVRVTDQNGCVVMDQAVVNTDISDFDLVLSTYSTCSVSQITASLPPDIINPVVEWSLDPGFSPVDQTGTVYTIPNDLDDNTILYVRVRGDNNCEISRSTVIRTTLPDFEVVLSSYDACTITEITAMIPPDIINPIVEWSFDPSFMPVDQVGSTYNIPNDLSGNPTLYVRVRGDNGCEIVNSTVLETVGDVLEGFETNFSECGSLTVNFNYTGDQGADISWDFGDMNTSDDTNPTHTFAESGIYTITITGATGTCEGMPFIGQINVVGPDIIDIDNENISDCDGENVTLNPGGRTDYNYSWSPSDVLDRDDVASPIANVSETTEFTVVISDPNNPNCAIEEMVLLTVSPLTMLDFSDRTSCDGDMIELNPTGDPSLIYTWSPASLFGSQVNDPNPTITVDGTILISVEVSDPGFDDCSDTYEFTVNQIPPYDVFVDTDAVQCPGGTLNINPVDNDSRNLNFKWFDINFESVSIERDFNTVITETTCFYLVVCDENFLCPDTTKVNALLDVEIPVDVEVMNDKTFCPGEEVTLNITSDIPDGATINWIDPASGNGTSTTIIASTTMNITATVTSELGCPFDGSAQVTVSNFPVSPSAVPGCVMFEDDVVQLGANPNGVSYTWTSSPPVEISNPNIANPTATGLTQNTLFTVVVVDEFDCTWTGMVQVAVEEDCDPPCLENTDLPNLFSPNGDGINDLFELDYSAGRAPATLIEMFIYDRWGNEVFYTTSSSVFWDGTKNGSEKPQDVYGYLIIATCPDGREIEVGGNVTLFR